MLGPGKYDEICTKAREDAKADSCILIVHNGINGSGFSTQATLPFLLTLPNILRHLADQIEMDLEKGKL